MEDEREDEREGELKCIAAIFPEISFDPNNPFSAVIELPVHPTSSVRVDFPAASDGLGLLTPPQSSTSGEDNERDGLPRATESHQLSYLPPLNLRITLPRGYPEEKPPVFELSTDPQWLPQTLLDELQNRGVVMWEDMGRSLVVYNYIDSLQQAAENAFGFVNGTNILEIPQELKISLLDHDIKATQEAFDKETFDCGVCLDPKKGSACHRMIDCGHVFCVTCLQDFYNNAIQGGDLAIVRCLDPGCAKKREQASARHRRKPKTQLTPSELLQIPLEHDVVTRYVKLKHKAELESDKTTVYCPRKWCQGAARSKKHRKPDGLEDVSSDDESENEMEKKKDFVAGQDLLSVCEDCGFAFCNRCYQGWHGELVICTPNRDTGDLTAEDKASLEYLHLHTTPCPTCAAPAQKTHGCNHMICFKCHSHFCYLCSAWLAPANPYEHYNNLTTGCYMRLWELEGGDGDDVDIGFHGGIRRVEIPPDPLLPDPGPAPAHAPEIVEPLEAPIPHQELHREGPLVLRINLAPAPPAPPPPAPAVPDPPVRGGGRRQRQFHPNQRNQAVPGGARRQPGAPGAQDRGGQRRVLRVRGHDIPAVNPNGQEAAHQAWVQMFVQMALNDEEDQLEWDSDDEDVPGAWDIPIN